MCPSGFSPLLLFGLFFFVLFFFGYIPVGFSNEGERER